MDHEKTWAYIAALPEEGLNVAIEAHIYHRTWHQVSIPNTERQAWELVTEDGHKTWSIVPHMHTTATWEMCMPLAWRYRLSLIPALGDSEAWLAVPPANFPAYVPVYTEHEARIAICRLALYHAICEKEG